MKTVTQILPLEATTVNNPSDRNGVTAGVIAGAIAEAISGAITGETAGVTAGALID